MSGSEMARTKEAVAAKMREKQAAGKTETGERARHYNTWN